MDGGSMKSVQQHLATLAVTISDLQTDKSTLEAQLEQTQAALRDAKAEVAKLSEKKKPPARTRNGSKST